MSHPLPQPTDAFTSSTCYYFFLRLPFKLWSLILYYKIFKTLFMLRLWDVSLMKNSDIDSCSFHSLVSTHSIFYKAQCESVSESWNRIQQNTVNTPSTYLAETSETVKTPSKFFCQKQHEAREACLSYFKVQWFSVPQATEPQGTEFVFVNEIWRYFGRVQKFSWWDHYCGKISWCRIRNVISVI